MTRNLNSNVKVFPLKSQNKKQVEDREAKCICIEKCETEIDPRRRVCTNYNETFGSDCEVYQARCFCDTNDSRCKGSDYQHVHIEYYGECKQMPVSIIFFFVSLYLKFNFVYIYEFVYQREKKKKKNRLARKRTDPIFRVVCAIGCST